ncbi:transcription antiterminator [Brevibacillus laterosporus]|uniref:BglG family transcription antiterminator n=1 Tax=Brevibacillus laterosporus TaxID=1465 RepID=UPI002405281A|nr:BglG family transcription antiterminator [Brevibacillus laterosporus]MDF9411339.1 transcription antiterminator [Brevibacillus laterosporus]
MKNDRKEAFIQYLASKNDWCTATSLANYFKVSTRTIRKYANEINQDQIIIASSPQGYQLVSRNQVKTDDNPTSPMDRMKVILKELILHSEGVNIFDLGDRLFLSVSSIENDIVHANKIIKPYQLKIRHRKDMLILTGEENDKRKLMSFIISQETSNEFLSLKAVQDSFPDYDVSLLKNEIVSILGEHNLYVNDYIMNNILLHLVITVDRIKNNNSVIQATNLHKLKSNLETKAANKIADFLEAQYSIRFNESERYNFILLLSSKTTLLNYQSLTPSSLNHYVDEHYVNLSKKLLEKVHERYFIEILDDEFFVNFTLHIRNLIFRAKNEQMAKNPLTHKLKHSYPLIYELAVFISNQIQLMENIHIKEDEISYIAFHIGSYFERKVSLEKKILCAVICPNYYDMQVQLIQKLEKKFHDSLEIIKVSSDSSEVALLEEIDLIISTLPLQKEQVPTVFVHPYLTEEDYEYIQSQINKLNKQKKIRSLKQYLDLYFDEDLFMKNVYLDSDEAYIAFMSNLLYEKGYVSQDYGKSVLERERMSSTAFNNNVAVPHSMHMDAEKTGICIMILDRPVNWGKEKVQAIVMISINKHQRELFSPFFEGVINILSEWKNVNELIKAKDYEDFMDKMTRLLHES